MLKSFRATKRQLRPRQGGFTYLFVLIAVALLSAGLLAQSEVWVSAAQRQKMVQLEWTGDQFTQAIGSYYQGSPGITKSYPKSLEELLDDRRFGVVRRHLRTIYPNPFSGVPDWELIAAADSTLRGVRVKFSLGEKPRTREFVYLPAQ